MALLWLEGFETYGETPGSAVSGMSRVYATAGADSNFTVRAGRGSGYSIETSNTILNNHFQTPAFTSSSTIIVGFAIKQDAYTAAVDAVSLREGSTIHLTLRLVGDTVAAQSTGEWRVLRGSTLLGRDTIGAASPVGTWSYVELVAVIADGTAGSFQVWVNGTQYLNITGVDTRNGGTGVIDNVRFTGSTGASDNTHFDDIYIMNNSGSFNTARVGSQAVRALFPEATTNNVLWTPVGATPSYECVNENPSNGNTDYVKAIPYSLDGLGESEGEGEGESGSLTDPPLLTADLQMRMVSLANMQSVKGIRLDTVAKKGASSYVFRSQVKIGVSSSMSTMTLSTSYTEQARILQTNPNTSALWTVTEINNARYGATLSTV